MHTLMKLEISTCWWPEDVCPAPPGCRTVQDTDKQGRVYEVFGLQPECHWWFCVSGRNPPPPSWDSSRTWDGFHHVIITPPPFFSCAVASLWGCLPPSHCVVVIFFLLFASSKLHSGQNSCHRGGRMQHLCLLHILTTAPLRSDMLWSLWPFDIVMTCSFNWKTNPWFWWHRKMPVMISYKTKKCAWLSFHCFISQVPILSKENCVN